MYQSSRSTTTGIYDKLQCSHNTTNTVSQSHQTNSNSILQIIFTLKLFYPARSAINCDVYVGGKVRVLELMRFFYLKHSGSK